MKPDRVPLPHYSNSPLSKTKLPHKPGFLPDYLNKPGVATSKIFNKPIKSKDTVFFVKNQLN